MNYISKANRDQEAARLIAQGRTVRKSSSRNVILSPDYVQDYQGTPTPNGFGGNAPEFMGTIYTLTVVS